MNIQIFGTDKCSDTRKAKRYFQERRITFQFVDFKVKGLSKGELDKVAAVVGLANMVDREGKEFAKRNLKYLACDLKEKLLEYPLLLRTPIVRNGTRATVGYCPEVWRDWE